MEQSPNQFPQTLPILKYTRQKEIEIPSDVIYIHQPMLPAKCYCFAVAKTNAAISLERVTNAQLLCLQAERRRQRMRLFHGRITDRALDQNLAETMCVNVTKMAINYIVGSVGNRPVGQLRRISL